MVIKTGLLVILTLIFLLFSFSTKHKHYQKMVVILGYLVLFAFILNPQWADKVAKFFGIESGAALITYISIALLSLISIVLYVKQKNQNESITKIIRHIGIKDAKKC
ncbi:MAG: DUF2304 domain-containing protein [Chlorobi bacterium]|nr:DUF2304 domain-containing protein [Chlorobiota bacterium]